LISSSTSGAFGRGRGQWAPTGDWRFWLLRGGRGAGKTRAGEEWVRAAVEAGHARHMALIGPTEAAVRRVMMEGESGLLAITPPWDRPRYEPSRHRLSWANGAVATLFSADAPERLRGPQHDAFWADELCAWRGAMRSTPGTCCCWGCGSGPIRAVSSRLRLRSCLSTNSCSPIQPWPSRCRPHFRMRRTWRPRFSRTSSRGTQGRGSAGKNSRRSSWRTSKARSGGASGSNAPAYSQPGTRAHGRGGRPGRHERSARP
jgi:hypothetical protein